MVEKGRAQNRGGEGHDALCTRIFRVASTTPAIISPILAICQFIGQMGLFVVIAANQSGACIATTPNAALVKTAS
jgi:hypothetical protein